MNKKIILSAISILLVFATVFAFAGCDSNTEDTTTTTVITAKNPLPTDITTSYDESSNLITDTTYSPEQLQANTVEIFNYANQKMNALKSGVVAKVKMSQGKGIGGASQIVELTDEEVVNLVKEALAEFVADAEKPQAEKDAIAQFNGKNFDVLTDEQFSIVNAFAQSKGITITFYPGNQVKVKRRDGVPMSDNEYVNTAIKSLDSYMLHADGFEIDEYVDIAEYIPLAGKDNVWNLSIEDIKSATCVDADGQRTITITLKGHEFEDIIEQEIIEKAYNVETVKNAEILAIEEEIGAADSKIGDADKKIEAADKALTKAEKKNDTAAAEKAKADKAAAEAEKNAAVAEKKVAEAKKREALSIKSIDENVNDIMAEFATADKYLVADKPVLQYKDCQIIIVLNLETEEIHTIEYKKSVDVSTTVTGVGSLENMGKVPVNFNYNSSVTYNIEREVKEEPATAA